MTKSLISLETLDAQELFTGESPTLDSLIQQVRDEVASFDGDVNTEEGRKDIASVAYTVARSKTALDTLGKDFVAGIKSQAKGIDEQRKSMREELDTLRDEVRKPLNEWEEEEKRKEEALEGRFRGLKKYTENADLDLEELKASLENIKATVIDESWSYLEEKAQDLKDDLIFTFNQRIEQQEKHEKEQAVTAAIEKTRTEAEAKLAEAMEKAEKEKATAIETAVGKALEEAAKASEEDSGETAAEDAGKKSSEEDS